MLAMPRTAAADQKTLSDLLSGMRLRGQSWCYSDLGAQAGFTIPPADVLFFHAVLHGSARLACAGGEVAELREGEAVMVLSGEAHALRTSADSGASTHEFLRAGRDVDVPPTYPFGAGRVQAHVLSGRLRADWPGETNRGSLSSLLRIGGAGSAAAALLQPQALALAGLGAGSSALLTRLASLLLVATLRAEPRCRQLFAPPQRDPIAQARGLIAANPAADWTVERLARSVGMGRSNFAAQFTQTVGRAPMEVVAEQRMENAAMLLRQGALKIAEVSEMAGYSSEAAFSRRFTRHFGISPSQMRAQAKASRAETGTAAPSEQRLLATRFGKAAPPRGRPASASMLVLGFDN
jgi:AraC-like DNA-binding protein